MNTVAMDFGTSNSAMAFRMPDGAIEFVRLEGETSAVIPSFLLVRDGEPEHVGQPAKNALAADPEHVIWGLKRLLGLNYHDAKQQIHRFQYVIKDHGGKLRIEVDGHILAPVDLISSFLGRIRSACDSPDAGLPFSGLPERLILTFPAYFDSQQITSLEYAAKKAGYESVQLLREPEAAAMAYKDFIDFSNEPLVMVIDWGAGTLDFFIAHFLLGDDGCPRVVETTPAYGDTQLGGFDMDDALVKRFKDLHGIGQLTLEEENRLRSCVESSKIALSERDSVTKLLAFGGQQYAFRLCRTSPRSGSGDRWICLEDTLADPVYGNILGQFKDHLRFALERNKLCTRDIERLILVGGPMCMTCVRAAVAEVFADSAAVLKQLARIETEGFPIDPFEAVAKGAVMSDQMGLGPVRLPFTYGFMMDGEMVEKLVIPADTLIARGGKKSVDYPSSIRIRAGDLLGVALYKAEDASGGQRHWRVGHYEFAPVAASGRGTAVMPSIEVDSHGICTLIVDDQIAITKLELRFKDGQHYSLDSAPDTMKLISSDEIKQLRISDPARYKTLTEDWDKGVFAAEEVDRQRQKALVLYRSVHQARNQGRVLPQGAEQLFMRLGTALEHVRSGLPVEADSPAAKTFQEMINARNELSQNLRNDSFEY